MAPHSTSFGLNEAAPQIRGSQTLNLPAPQRVKGLTWLLDLAIGLIVFSLGFWIIWFSPREPLILVGAWLALSLALRTLLIYALGASFGESVWNLRRRGSPTEDTGLFWNGGLETRKPIWMSVLTILSAILFLQLTVLRHPLWKRATAMELPVFLPSASEPFRFASFFYALGAWPVKYEGKPVFYSIPYEKGPPRQFIGHAIARWDMPSTRVTFEGPKSPSALDPEHRNAERVKACLMRWLPSLACVKIRKETLARPIDEMTAMVGSAPSQVRWLSIYNPALPQEEQLQGVWLESVGRVKSEIRFILITAGGTHQAISLDFPSGQAGIGAKKLFMESLGSQRISDDLGHGKAWADQQLQSVDIRALEKLQPDEAMNELAVVQMQLVSKATVDPASFDAFFHLGGTAALMKKLTLKTPTVDAAAVAKNLIEISHRYAGDISPEDPRMAQLRNLWLESRKY